MNRCYLYVMSIFSRQNFNCLGKRTSCQENEQNCYSDCHLFYPIQLIDYLTKYCSTLHPMENKTIPKREDFQLINSGKFDMNPIPTIAIPIAWNNFPSVSILRWFFGVTKRAFCTKLDCKTTIRTGPFLQILLIVVFRSFFPLEVLYTYNNIHDSH